MTEIPKVLLEISVSGAARAHSLKRCPYWLALVLACCAAAQCGAQTSSLLQPVDVAYDSAGNMYIADAAKNQVMEVSLAGVTSVIAGTGEQGFAGDGGPAALAQLNAPSSVAVAPDGTMYIADAGNQRIRSVVGGVIQTVAGTGAKGFGGDGADARLAVLNGPAALALDSSGSLLISDSGNHRVRRLALGAMATVAGNGVQGFGGDGGLATAAVLDTPAGVTVASDGRVFVADSHNHRIRVIDNAGFISTFAGTGAKGFSGDGGAAIAAQLFLPRGMTVTAAGAVVFADSDNHRLRSVDMQGVITTIAGNGVQGHYTDGAIATGVSLDTPRSVTLSGFGAATYSDMRNKEVSVVAADRAMYTAAPSAARTAVVTLAVTGATTYGDGAATASVTSAAPVPQGTVTLTEEKSVLASGVLVNGVVVLPVGLLNAGQHTLTAAYGGDVLHAAASSAASVITVTARVVVATAASATMVYGDVNPPLTGTLAGVLSQDAGNVMASFAANAPDLSPVGMYPIAVTLSGSASRNYSVALAPASGSLQITQASASVLLQVPSSAYAGLPVTLRASVAPALRGVPAGTLNFLDGGTVVATANVSGGVATAVYLSPTAGTHMLTASYSGDKNFVPATSTGTGLTVSTLPDFALTVQGSGSQTVQGGAIASYTLQVAPQPAPFSGSVVFSVSGLQPGAKASFSPAAVVPGNAAALVVLSIQTVAQTGSWPPGLGRGTAALAVLLGWPLLGRRRKLTRSIAAVAILIVPMFMSGCGARTIAATTAAKTYSVSITATSTDLAGTVVTHSVPVSLTVE